MDIPPERRDEYAGYLADAEMLLDAFLASDPEDPIALLTGEMLNDLIAVSVHVNDRGEQVIGIDPTRVYTAAHLIFVTGVGLLALARNISEDEAIAELRDMLHSIHGDLERGDLPE